MADNFETIRRHARELRGGVAAADDEVGRDVLQRALEKRGFELQLLAADDPLLCGADGALDRQNAYVYVRKDLDEAQITAVAAHELGHLELHDPHNQCQAVAPDISAPEQPTPVGLAGIEGYGARERRELQANVYAREFLLPRVVARNAFLEQGTGATELARKLQIPVGATCQQYADSLLLPPANPPAPRKKLSLDSSQRRAAEHSDSPLFVEAGPGSGKTTALVGRVLHLINDLSVPPSNILVLTFSNKAALELSERAAEELPDAAHEIWAGTFHAFGLELMRKFHQLFGLEQEIQLMARSDAIELLEDQLPTLDLTHYHMLYEPAFMLNEALNAVSRAKDEVVDHETYASLAAADLANARDADETKRAERALEVAKIYRIYQENLTANGRVDFGDLIMRPTLLLEHQPELRNALMQQYPHVLVDEYQDVNRASVRLLKSFCGSGKGLWTVGDARQSVYRFRGASPANAALFEKDFPGGKRLPLSKNYRSTPEIVSAFTRFAATMKASSQATALQLEANKSSTGTFPTFSEADDYEEEISVIAQRIVDRQALGSAYREQAVICRTNDRLSAMAEGLEARGIPVLHLGSLFERPEVRDLLSLLSFVADEGGSGLVRIANFDNYRIPLSDVDSFIAACKHRDQMPIDALQDLDGIGNLSSAGMTGLAQLRDDLKGITRDTHPNTLIKQYLFDNSQYLRRLFHTNSIDVQLKSAAIYQLFGALRTVSSFRPGLPIHTFLDKIRRLLFLNEERDLRQLPVAALDIDAVRLITIHGAKGLEFPIVHLPMLLDGGIPKQYSGEKNKPPSGMVVEPDYYPVDGGRYGHDEEQECLFFVAISRAMDELHLYRSKKQRTRTRKRSPYLNHIGAIDEIVSPTSLTRAIALDDGTINLGHLTVPPITERDITALSSCPRRYFYDRVFRLSARRKDGPFIRAHACIYAAIDALQALQNNEEATEAMLLDKLEEVWSTKGPTDHSLEPEYRRLAETTVRTLARHLAGIPAVERDDLKLVLSNGEILLNPHHWGAFPDGTTVIRLFKTGRTMSPGDENVQASYNHLAKKRFGSGRYQIDVIQLGKEDVTPVKHGDAWFSSRIERTDHLLRDASARRFPAAVDQSKCSRCPHFFICSAVPRID